MNVPPERGRRATALPGDSPFWPGDALSRALRAAILHAELPILASEVEPLGPDATDGAELARWLRRAARGMGLEGSPRDVRVSDLATALQEPGPYLLVVRHVGASAARGIALVRGALGGCTVVRPGGGEWRTTPGEVSAVLRRATTSESWVSRLFDGLEGGQAAAARLLDVEPIGAPTVTVARYELDAAHPLAAQLRSKRAGRRALAYLLVTALQATAAVGAAWTLGDAALTGIIDVGRVAAWSMLAASDVPLQYLASTILGDLSLDVGATLKRRLLEGTLSMQAGDAQRQGFGALLARLNEASVVEQTSVAEIVGVFAPAAQLMAALFLLARGALPQVLVSLQLAFLVAAGALVASMRGRHRAWYAARLRLTEDLVDKIVGHRTRTVQDDPEKWHDDEDAQLEGYGRLSARWDQVAGVATIYGRLWLLVAGMGLLLAFVSGAPVAALLVSGVAIFLAMRGFSGLLAAASRLVAWLCAWDGVRPLLAAGRLRARTPGAHVDSAAAGLDTVVSSLSFAYREGARPVLSEATLRVRPGERILLEGPSGGGKTTLSKLLTGELRPTGGTILVEGVDFYSVSEVEWRRRVASAPQFHENYLFSNTFAFNVDPRLLDGLISPEALQVCRELGLEPLLAKMPSGAAQLLGETGWQLSHGERSRVFIARALLQGAGVVVLDESFGALDPESLASALDCVRRRARTLVVIAHT